MVQFLNFICWSTTELEAIYILPVIFINYSFFVTTLSIIWRESIDISCMASAETNMHVWDINYEDNIWIPYSWEMYVFKILLKKTTFKNKQKRSLMLGTWMVQLLQMHQAKSTCNYYICKNGFFLWLMESSKDFFLA